MKNFKLFGELSYLGDGEECRQVETLVFENRDMERCNPESPEQGHTVNVTGAIELERAQMIGAQVENDLPQIRERMSKADVSGDAPKQLEFVSPVSVDVPLFPASPIGGQNWHIGDRGNQKFGTLSDALVNMGLPHRAVGRQYNGQDVGVIVVDGGLSRDYLDAISGNASYGGGWSMVGPENPGVLPLPGQVMTPYQRMSDIHGNMIARNILNVAPAVTIYDAPILPDQISDIPAFSSVATVLMRSIAWIIEAAKTNKFLPQHKHWIVVNAWAAANSLAEPAGIISFAANRAHQLNAAVIDLAKLDNVEVVFAAGNAGAFQPAAFTGPYDRGHFRSIWGCNGLPEVHTVGAARTDGLPIGASSQGPSRQGLQAQPGENQKPDFVAPSWFCEDSDPSILNTGTSAACALFAGVLATMASKGGPVTSTALRQQLLALPSLQGDWHPQNGRGTVVLV